MNSVTLTDHRTNKSYEFDILNPTVGSDVIDIRTLYQKTGMFTYDPGYTSTASCSSAITYINGEEGTLAYRGHTIEKLASEHTYLEVCYLLLEGALPDHIELQRFDKELRKRAFIPENLLKIFNAFPDGSHPMSNMAAAITALSSFHFEHLDATNKEDLRVMARRLIAKIPTIAAFSYRHHLGIPLIYPDLDRSYTENFLYMLRAYPTGPRLEIRDVEIDALDAIFTLHADHEQNASTSVVRSVGSTGAHPYAAISAGVAALWGRAHGGANESVIAQLEMIGHVNNVDTFIARAKDPEDDFRLMGFGHRVYKNFDPRAKILKKLLDELKHEIHIDLELLKVAERIETIALNDDYFIQRNLYPNIDFYSGLILTALGIPRSMFTVIFVMGRTVGWLAQWIELKNDAETKITRPRQRYIGPEIS